MANIDLGNLTRYDGKIKQYAEDKYLSKNTANWQMTEKAGAVTCYPVPNTELEPIIDFSFKEIPPTSGDKSPTNPSTIEGVSSINLTRCGKNLMPINTGFEGNAWGSEKDGIIWTKISDAIIKGNGTASKNTGINLIPRLHLPIGCTYTYSAIDNNTPSGIRGVIWQSGADFNPYDDGYGKAFLKVRYDSPGILPSVYVSKGSILTNTIFKVQIELGNQKTEFESPASNTYTYSLNNTYYGGSVNLATGLMTVTHNISKVGDYQSTVEFNSEYNCWRVYITPKADYTVLPICTHSTFKQGPDFLNAIDNTFRWAAGGLGQWFMFKSPVTTAEEFLAVYENAYIVFKLLNPYTVQLDPVQIKSLTALDKNTPRLNTLYTNADSIQVGYQKHSARTAYELENAILALGGGE